MATAAISTSDVSKIYRTGVFSPNTVEALEGVSLDVPKGAIFGLLGPNGAGKTTLVKVLLGLVHPTTGQAHLFGTPVRTPDARRRVGFLPEGHRFPGFLTAKQTLQVYGRLADLPAARRSERISDLLAHVGLADRRDAKVSTFSKGMLQRLGLAQALLNDPDLLFLDEPTSGVDPMGRRGIRDLILDLSSDGTTIFLNSHLLSEVEKVCTQVAILRDGRIVREGTIEALTTVEQVYDLVTTAIPEALMEASELAPSPQDPPSDPALRRYRLHADDRGTLNAFLDRLRAHDVEVDSIAPVRRSLEESFINVLDTAEEADSD